MHTELLQHLGLSTNEAKIYEALVTYGGSGVSTISLRAKVHRRNAYDAVHRLIEKGLVSEVFSQGETIYEAVEPGKLMELVRDKERKLELALPDLLSSFQDHKSEQRAYIYKGPDGVKNYLREVLKCGEDVYSFGAKGAWFDPRIESFTEWFLDQAKKKGIKMHHIFDHEVRDHLKKVPRAVGGKHKFLPKSSSTISCIDIFGDHVVTYTGLRLGTLDDDLTVFVMVSPQLADAYRTWWKLVWDLLPEERTRKRPPQRRRSTKRIV